MYAIVSDGDLMEGVAAEAASLAGHLKLGKLIYLYDDNDISIDGSTDITFAEDVGKRFQAQGWHTQEIDGHDPDAIDEAILERLNERAQVVQEVGRLKQGAGAAVILASTHFGFPLSTTHVINGGVMGAGAAKRISAVRWGVAGQIVWAWVLTIPASALIGALTYEAFVLVLGAE